MPARPRRSEKPLLVAVGDTVTAFADLVRSLSAAATRGAERARVEFRRWKDAASEIGADAKRSAGEVRDKAASAAHDLTDRVEGMWQGRRSRRGARSGRARAQRAGAGRSRRRR